MAQPARVPPLGNGCRMTPRSPHRIALDLVPVVESPRFHAEFFAVRDVVDQLITFGRGELVLDAEYLGDGIGDVAV